MARESIYVFLLLRIWCKEKKSNPDCKCLAQFRYSCILTFLASSFLFTWPTTNIKSENIFIAFHPILRTIAIPSNKASYSTSLFVAENPSLRDFSMIIPSEDTITSSTLDPLWFVVPSTYTFQGRGSGKEIIPTDLPSILGLSPLSSNKGSANSTTRSVRTYTFIEVRGMYLISKALKIIAHFATFLM